MNRIWLKGGFGNILFQIAAGSRDGVNSVFVLNFLVSQNIISRLLKWKVHDLVLPKGNFIFKKESLLTEFFVAICFKLSLFKKKPVFWCQDEKGEDELLWRLKKNNIGYFSRSDFLSRDLSGINRILTDLIEMKSNYTNSHEVVYHFRGTDGMQKEKNFLYLSSLFILHEDNLIVVTDDVLPVLNLGIKTGNVISSTVLDDFFILANTRRMLFLSDSTFAWWAAHLVQSNVEVYMPSRLFEEHGYYGNGILKLI